MNLSTLADLPLNNPTDDNVIIVLINDAAHAYSSQDSPYPQSQPACYGLNRFRIFR